MSGQAAGMGQDLPEVSRLPPFDLKPRIEKQVVEMPV